MKKIWSRTAEKKWRHRFSHYKAYGDFFRRSRAANPQSVVRAGWNSNSSELSCMSSLPASMKRIGWKNRLEKVETPFSPLQPYGSFLLPWKPEFWSDLIQNQMQLFPQPNDASDKIEFWSTHWFQRYSCLKVWTHGRIVLYNKTHCSL